MIVVTALKLHKVSLSANEATWNVDVSNVCLLGTMENGGNM